MGSAFIPWSAAYDVGIPLIDRQHEGLAKTISDFYAVIQSEHRREEIFFLLNNLVRYAEEHFRDEEALMEAGHYPELARQRIEHEKFVRRVFDLAASYQRHEAEIDEKVMEFLKSWLIDHILKEDRKLGVFFTQKGYPKGWEKAGGD